MSCLHSVTWDAAHTRAVLAIMFTASIWIEYSDCIAQIGVNAHSVHTATKPPNGVFLGMF